MINHEDFTKQEKVYSRNGDGRWIVAGYCPSPSLSMRNVDTGERVHFGIGGSMGGEFDEIPGLRCDNMDREELSALINVEEMTIIINRLFDAEDEYGAGFYCDGDWPSIYDALRRLFGRKNAFYNCIPDCCDECGRFSGNGDDECCRHPGYVDDGINVNARPGRCRMAGCPLDVRPKEKKQDVDNKSEKQTVNVPVELLERLALYARAAVNMHPLNRPNRAAAKIDYITSNAILSEVK